VACRDPTATAPLAKRHGRGLRRGQNIASGQLFTKPDAIQGNFRKNSPKNEPTVEEIHPGRWCESPVPDRAAIRHTPWKELHETTISRTDVVAGTVSSSWHIATVTGRKQVAIQTRVSVSALDGFRDFTPKYRVTYKPQGGEAVTVDVTVEINHEAGPVQGMTTVFGKEAFTAIPAGIPAGATVTVDLLKESTGKVRDILAGDPPKFKKLELKQSKQIGPSRITP
jgi:hypothetical protein